MFLAKKLNKGAGVVSTPDPQFNYVTMLLHGDGTNGAQNNTFLDSSTNNFTITRNGNTTQGSFSPYGSNWSNYFDGAGDYLNFGTSSQLTLSGDFTVEGWFFVEDTSSTYKRLFNNSPGTTPTGYFYVYTNGTDIRMYNIDVGTLPTVGTFSGNSVWFHLAICRSGSTTRVFVNGTQTYFYSGTTTFTNSGWYVGGGPDTEYHKGYISNHRVVVGSALYTSNFTPSTTPLTAVTNTKLLTCQSNRFVDNSTNNFAITVSGTPSVQRFNPFGTSTAYSTSVIGGSGYFDGDGDNLSYSQQTYSSDFTFECWVYQTGSSGSYPLIFASNTASVQIMIDYQGTGKLTFYTSSSTIQSASNVFQRNQWNHLAYVRSGSTVTIYYNGTSVASGTQSNAISISFIGGYSSSAYTLNGYMSDARITTSALYTTTFTPPTAPLTAISGTSLLLNYTNGAIYDNAMINDLETVGNAQISTSVVKYGTGSLKFDGTNNCCLTTKSFMSSSAPFTFECWAYWNDTGTSGDMGMLCSQYASGASGRMLFGSQSGDLVLRVDGGTVYLTTSVSTGTWYFVAWTFDGTTHRLFLNGTLASSSTSVPALYTGVNTSIGGQPNSLLADYCLDGYMDEVRITRGVARYTTTFTPPTAAFPNTGPV